jgi:predicted PolB exonuclease-like 3'-5' exonuclease
MGTRQNRVKTALCDKAMKYLTDAQTFVILEWNTQNPGAPTVHSLQINPDIGGSRPPKLAPPSTEKGFLIFDTESVPDGNLLAKVKYRGEALTPEQAVERAQQEARELSRQGSDFLPVPYQVPIAVCALRVALDFTPTKLACLDAPLFRTAEMVKQFWKGVNHYPKVKLVTFNGRSFDMPLMELAAFDHGCTAAHYFENSRHRFNGHLDLFDWLGNFGGCRLSGGLSMMAQRAGGGSPVGCGKMGVAGDQVYGMYRQGKIQEINDYCMFDTLDTYFIFLRTRVMIGEITGDRERELTRYARAWLGRQVDELPALRQYLEAWDQNHA